MVTVETVLAWMQVLRQSHEASAGLLFPCGLLAVGAIYVGALLHENFPKWVQTETVREQEPLFNPREPMFELPIFLEDHEIRFRMPILGKRTIPIFATAFKALTIQRFYDSISFGLDI